jgi:hypothetical protein
MLEAIEEISNSMKTHFKDVNFFKQDERFNVIFNLQEFHIIVQHKTVR